MTISASAPRKPTCEDRGTRYRLSLRGNFAWTLAGNTVYAACQWGMLAILARLGTPVMVGQFALALAVTAPIILFANLNLRTVQATDVFHERSLGDYLGVRLLTLLLALVVVGAVITLGGYRGETAWLIAIVALVKSIESVSDVFYGFQQQNHRMDRVARSRLMLGPAQLIVLGLAVFCTGSLPVAAASMALAAGTVLALHDLPGALRTLAANGCGQDRQRELRPRWVSQTIRALVVLALPLGLMRALDSLHANIPRYLIEHCHGPEPLGYYSALASLMVTGGVVVMAMGEAATPGLAEKFAHDPPAFRRHSINLIGLCALVGLIGVLAAWGLGKPLLTVLFGPVYARHASSLIWIMVAAGLWYVASSLWFAITAARCFRSQVPLLLATVTTTAVASHWLIPPHALDGAVAALCAGMSIRLIGGAAILYRLQRSDVSEDAPCR